MGVSVPPSAHHCVTPGLASRCWLTSVTAQPPQLSENQCKRMIIMEVELSGLTERFVH